MDIITAITYDDLSQVAAEIIIKKVKKNPNLVIGMATGSTPTKLYEYLIKDYKENGTSYEGITTFNLDEYVGLDKNDANSYYEYMNKNLFKHININRENTHIPNGKAEDLEKECRDYERKLHSKGPVDIQILGLGENGHIGFNEPGTRFDSKTHVVKLTESTRKANARFFETMDNVPHHAITMGIDSIMNAKEILLLVSGKNKAKAYDQLINGSVSDSFPASILRKHPCVKIIADNTVRQNSSIIA
ncbi:glucosamine-6-phosphate deaminase [Sutcliffiella horikoshii]|uniref:Glucosamine-6-phosphate deaminase n=1 Tax=Sutcliffiella horikoshii TaxID=79883 RepID=A0A5D4SWP6_9BACI|nr:glucosamine-6-phosphate deaminase [Sutcliffiella horikoshii]TYS67800.1 glucosamine-6-phosphate deaminase [Sutcliffiella horikoshii]